MTRIFSFPFAIAITLCVFVHKCFGELPADIQKCHPGDVVCIAKTTTDILVKYPNGNKELGLRNLEPVHLEELVIGRKNGNSPLSLNLKFKNLDMSGLSKANITRVVGFEKDPRNSKYEMYVTLPLLTLRGDYEANGRILLLPVVGKGKAEINFKNFRTAVKAKMATFEKDGKLRIEISKLKVKNNVDLMKVRMDGLFGGNKELGEEINNVINTNWMDVWNELESGINEGFTHVVSSIIGDVLKTLYYDEVFLE